MHPSVKAQTPATSLIWLHMTSFAACVFILPPSNESKILKEKKSADKFKLRITSVWKCAWKARLMRQIRWINYFYFIYYFLSSSSLYFLCRAPGWHPQGEAPGGWRHRLGGGGGQRSPGRPRATGETQKRHTQDFLQVWQDHHWVLSRGRRLDQRVCVCSLLCSGSLLL